MMAKVETVWTFETMEQGVAPVKTASFKEAWKAMYEYVKKGLDSNSMPWQLLETGIWIVQPSGAPIMFYDARDMACNAGWLVNGKSTI